jgi:RNA polymerase sigma-70 factor, ECF subfamily
VDPTLESRFLQLVQENQGRMLRICTVYAADPHDRDDLYQEILVQIWKSLPRLKEAGLANTWLYRVALNTALTHRRKASRQPFTPHPHEDLHALADRQAGEAAPSEATQRLLEAIQRLPAVEKAVATLYLEEVSYQGIAEITGLTAGHVGVLLHRIRKKLLEELRNEEVP